VRNRFGFVTANKYLSAILALAILENNEANMLLTTLALALHINYEIQEKPTFTSGFVSVGEVKLHYLDWGGKGETLLIITGTGDTAHAYEEFAPKFTDKFHVIALTRRGYGKSDKPASGYDIPTLSMDVIGFLDAKGIKKTNIMCHSAGGDETTYIATKLPNRVGKLVYMEAAYNRATISRLEELDPMGADKPRSKEQSLHWKGMDEFRPDFKAIKAPVLSFYSMMESHPAVNEKTAPELKEKAEKFFRDEILPYQTNNIAQFRKDLPNAKVVVLTGTDHYFFEDKKIEATVVSTIRDFLTGKE